MAINKDKNIMKNIVVTKETEAKVKVLAEKNKRSWSSQCAYMLEQMLQIYEGK